MNCDSILSLQHIFSMLTPTNSFATINLFCVSVKREFAIPFSLCTSLSVRFTSWHCFDVGGGVKKLGRVGRPGHAPHKIMSLAGDADRNRFESQHGRAVASGWFPGM